MSTLIMTQELPRTALRFGLTVSRLPLTAAEAVLSRGAEDWPPTLAFEGFEANVKRVVGGLLRDDLLIHEGELVGAKVERLRQASELKTIAAQRRDAADADLERRRAHDQERRDRAATAAKERKAELDRKKATAKQQAERAAATKAQAARKAKAASTTAVERKARRTRRDSLTAEQTVVAKERAAANRARAAATADKRLDRSKRTRAARA
jgi:hypothetical protein